MVKIYPDINLKNEDVYYSLMKSVVFTMCFCVCTCVGLIVVLTSVIEKDNNDGSY